MGTRHTAKRVLRFRGKAAIVRRIEGGTFDPLASTVSGQSQRTVETKGQCSSFELDEIDGVEVQRDDLRFLVPVLDFEVENGFEPRAGDEVEFIQTKKLYRVKGVRTFNNDVAYRLHLRGGSVVEDAA
jgi:hypothetical protein